MFTQSVLMQRKERPITKKYLICNVRIIKIIPAFGLLLYFRELQKASSQFIIFFEKPLLKYWLREFLSLTLSGDIVFYEL